MRVGTRDEGPHPAGSSSAWTETWSFRVAAEDGSIAVAVTVVRSPAERRVGYWCAVLGRDRTSTAVLEHDIVAPRDDRLELRGSGIWADHVCETPFDHWSVGLEAFGLAFEDPADAVGSGRGTPVAMGLDLEWEDHGDPVDLSEAAIDDGYGCTGFAHGDLLLDDRTIALSGPGQRMHRWGTGPSFGHWWSVADRVGRGVAPWAETESLGRALATDRSGVVTELSAGVVVDATGGGRIGWWARPSGEPGAAP
ncbi:MAG: hypothetical protein ACXIVQ_18265 [Acidimicrobiales bacterium]